MSEQQLQAKILKYLYAIGAYSIKVVSATRAGVPDIVCCYKGKFIAIEVKLPGNKPSALQVSNIELIQKAEGYAFVAYKLEDVANFFSALDNPATQA